MNNIDEKGINEENIYNAKIAEFFPTKETCRLAMESERCKNVYNRARYNNMKTDVIIFLAISIFFFIISRFFVLPVGMIVFYFNAWELLCYGSAIICIKNAVKYYLEGCNKIAVFFARRCYSYTLKEEIIISDIKLSKYKIRLEEWKEQD